MSYVDGMRQTARGMIGQNANLIALFLGCMALCSCLANPYESLVPLSSEGARLDERLIGSWSIQGQAFHVKKGSDTHYVVQQEWFDKEHSEWRSYKTEAFLTLIRGVLLINMQNPKNPSRFIFAEYQFSGDTFDVLKLSFIEQSELFKRQDGSALQFRKPSDFYRYIEFNMDNSKLFRVWHSLERVVS